MVIRKTAKPDHEAKTCDVCGRTIEWRKKWERDWDSVRYCSDKCRQATRTTLDDALETTILEMLAERGRDKTICPSDAARKVAPDGWEALMERTRSAARRLVASQRIVITQGGRVVDPSLAKGPIRLRLR